MRKGFEEHGNDLLREMVAVFAQVLMSADADTVCGAAFGSRSPERVNRRNGYRSRIWDTRHHLDVVRLPILPDEADPPLVVDSDAVLSFSVAPECFQVVPGERRQVT